MRKSVSLLLTLYCLIAGLLTPHLVSVIQDAQLKKQTYPLSETAHYAYRGTLLNRVLAFSAHLNSSPAVKSSLSPDGSAPEHLWTQLASFLPLPREAFPSEAESLVVSPSQYSAEYRFIQIEYTAENLTLRAVVDEETSLPVRIELHASAQVMTEYAQSHSMWDILHAYGGLLKLGDPADDGATTISSVLRRQDASLRGAPFTVSVSIMPAAGTLLLTLTGIPPT